MGRLTEAFDFLSCEKIPPQQWMDWNYCHIDLEGVDFGLRKVRTEVLKNKREAAKEKPRKREKNIFERR